MLIDPFAIQNGDSEMRREFEAQMEQLKSDYEYKLNAMRQRIKDLETDATVSGYCRLFIMHIHQVSFCLWSYLGTRRNSCSRASEKRCYKGYIHFINIWD